MDYHGLTWLIALALAVLYGLPWFFAHRRKQRLVASGIADIDAMDGKAFEQYLEVLFGRLGYKVERTRYVGDYGADLVTLKGGVKTVIQAKRYAKAVGIKAVQEAVAAKGMYGCTEAMVVTNSTYTRAAVELARANGVALWDRERLVETLLQVRGEGATTPPASQIPAPLRPASEPCPAANVSPRCMDPICVTCEVPVSEKVHRYCVAHPKRFGGAIYCFEHQKAIKQKAA